MGRGDGQGGWDWRIGLDNRWGGTGLLSRELGFWGLELKEVDMMAAGLEGWCVAWD